MKKVIRKIAILMFAAMLFITPTSSVFAATTNAVLINDFGYGKFFSYQPPHQLQPGQSVYLANNILDGYWLVPNGYGYHLYASSNFGDNGGSGVGVLHYSVIKMVPTTNGPTYTIVAQGTSDNGGFFIDIPPCDGPSVQSPLYLIALTNNSSKTIWVNDYCVYYQ